MNSMRYSAHTVSGSLLFSADTLQRVADRVAEHEENRRKAWVCDKLAPVGYVYDNRPGVALPYIALKRDEALPALVGTSHATFEDVCAAWGMK